VTYYRSASPGRGAFGGLFSGIPDAVRFLLFATVGVFVLQSILYRISPSGSLYFEHGLAVYLPVLLRGGVWQIVTYQFLHGGWFHVAANMLGLWIFGSPLERYWGRKRFLGFYLTCGAGGGLVYAVFSLIGYLLSGARSVDDMQAVMVGASGSVFGLLLAYALLFPNRNVILFPFMIPVRARVLVIVFGLLNLLWAVDPQVGGGTAYTAHLGGLATGYLYLRGFAGPTRLFRDVLWRFRRRRFRVVDGKRKGSGGGNGEGGPGEGPYTYH
jgi:membrane associated rhomboid family serine protease